MTMETWKRVAVVTGACALAAAAWAVPPRVVFASPDNADMPVDPETKAIRITFDQEMSAGGRSICGGGATFPEFAGKPYWADAWTMVVPVKLEAEHSYSLSINCPAAQNFRSKAGEAAEIYPISFRTGKVGERAETLGAKEIGELTAALRKAIDDHYSYRDLRVKDWDKVFAAARASFEEATTASQFARAAVKMLAVAEDVHLGVVVGDMRLGTYGRASAANYDLRVISKIVPKYTQHNRRVGTGEFEDGIVYLQINSWGVEKAEEELKPVFEALDAAKGARGVVVDVRANGGGDEPTARTVAARFLAEAKVYSKSRTRNPEVEGGWEGPFDRVVKPCKGCVVLSGKVAVLIGGQCASSNESFIKMMQEPPGRLLFGARTFGSSGRPLRHEIGHGLGVSLPSWQDLMPDGTMLEGKGITPDREVEWKGDGGDAVLEAALGWLREK